MAEIDRLIAKKKIDAAIEMLGEIEKETEIWELSAALRCLEDSKNVIDNFYNHE